MLADILMALGAAVLLTVAGTWAYRRILDRRDGWTYTTDTRTEEWNLTTPVLRDPAATGEIDKVRDFHTDPLGCPRDYVPDTAEARLFEATYVDLFAPPVWEPWGHESAEFDAEWRKVLAGMYAEVLVA